MHAPNQISLAAKASGEPEFREVGLGPWAETHPANLVLMTWHRLITMSVSILSAR